MVSWRPDPGRGGLALGLPLLYGLERGAMLEQQTMCSGLSSQNFSIRFALSLKGEEWRASSPPWNGATFAELCHKNIVNF